MGRSPQLVLSDVCVAGAVQQRELGRGRVRRVRPVDGERERGVRAGGCGGLPGGGAAGTATRARARPSVSGAAGSADGERERAFVLEGVGCSARRGPVQQRELGAAEASGVAGSQTVDAMLGFTSEEPLCCLRVWAVFERELRGSGVRDMCCWIGDG